MVRRIGQSQKDHFHLELLDNQRKPKISDQPKDYKKKVVLKPWGYEYLIFENENVAVWFLHIKDKHSTSMHCHPNKKTSLILLSGEAICNTFGRRNFLKGLDAIILEKTVFHSTKALSSEGIDLIEVETPPNKSDLVRLNDDYGRQHQGYEGLKEMRTTNLSDFNYFFFENPEDGVMQMYESPSYQMSMKRYCKKGETISNFNDDSFYTLFQGQLSTPQGKSILDVGDAAQGKTLNSIPELKINDEIILLKLTQNFQVR